MNLGWSALVLARLQSKRLGLKENRQPQGGAFAAILTLAVLVGTGLLGSSADGIAPCSGHLDILCLVVLGGVCLGRQVREVRPGVEDSERGYGEQISPVRL